MWLEEKNNSKLKCGYIPLISKGIITGMLCAVWSYTNLDCTKILAFIRYVHQIKGVTVRLENGMASLFDSGPHWSAWPEISGAVSQTLLTGGQKSRWMTQSLPSDTGTWGRLKSRRCLEFTGATGAWIVKESEVLLFHLERGIINDEASFYELSDSTMKRRPNSATANVCLGLRQVPMFLHLYGT